MTLNVAWTYGELELADDNGQAEQTAWNVGQLEVEL